MGEGNCESKIVSRQRGDNFCPETSRCLAGPSGLKFLRSRGISSTVSKKKSVVTVKYYSNRKMAPLMAVNWGHAGTKKRPQLGPRNMWGLFWATHESSHETSHEGVHESAHESVRSSGRGSPVLFPPVPFLDHLFLENKGEEAPPTYQATKKEPKPKLLSPDIFWWGWGSST